MWPRRDWRGRKEKTVDMSTTITKLESLYYLGTEHQVPLPKDAYHILPNLQLPSGNFLWLLLKASLDLKEKYYHDPNNADGSGLNYEPDFYNHLGNLWEGYSNKVDDSLSVNSDIVKLLPDEIKPDLILNDRYNDRQEVVVEVKRNVAATDLNSIYKDWNKLFRCTKGNYNDERQRYEFIPGYESYKIGVFFFMGGNMNVLIRKLREDINRFQDYIEVIGEWKSKTFCICCSGNGSLEYATMSEIQEEISNE